MLTSCCKITFLISLLSVLQVQKGSNIQSEKTISAAKHDTEIIEELLLQHHTMASIMQSRLTNMQVCVFF
jgi:hypothetical protein